MDIRELIKENREINAVIKNENCVDKDGRVELHCVYDDNNDNNDGDNDDDYINISDDDDDDDGYVSVNDSNYYEEYS